LSEYDIVHLQDLLSFHAISTINYCRSNKIPFIFTPHGSLPWLNEKKPLNLLYKKFWGNGILMKAKKIICLNQVEIAQCERLGVPKDRLVIVPNGVNLDEYVNLPQKGSFRKRWSISNDQKIILFLARIHKIKGPDLLAKAFTLISKNNNNLKLVFAGPDGGYLTFLKGLIRELGIEEKVLFTGPLYERDKFEAYVDADVYVLPSVYETFPISIIEACACGTPVIVTDRCGIANIIDGQVGLVVPYNADALGEAILNILSDDNKKQEYGARGKLLVQDKLNWTNISEKLETVYINTLKQSPPSSKKYEE
jgi:glycosyltransferase involved in cell wall biosynthesis